MSEPFPTVLKLLQQLELSNPDARFASPMLFARETDLSVKLLLRPACIGEEVINHSADNECWNEVMPLWLAKEFVEANKAELMAGFADELNCKFMDFAKRNW